MQSFAHFTPTPQKIVAQKSKTISSKEEFEVIKTHCMQGANMLRRLENFENEPLLQTAYDIARWHHERWDGRGYPDGLQGNDIPISAQIVSLADVYDALTSELLQRGVLPRDRHADDPERGMRRVQSPFVGMPHRHPSRASGKIAKHRCKSLKFHICKKQ